MTEVDPNRWEVISDGPGRWVLVDHENDDPAPVFKTKAEADHAMVIAGIEAMGGIEGPRTFDDETGRPMRSFTIKL